MDLAHLITTVPGVRPRGAGGTGVRVCDLTEDSRTVVPGSLFVARRGLKTDGRQFVRSAVEAGAVAVLTDAPDLELDARSGVPVLVAEDLAGAVAHLAERFYGYPSRKLRVVGVTGTNGKTTTAHLTHGLLNAVGVRCGLIGTVVVDDGREVAPAEMTTLPAIELSRTLGTMVEAGCKAVAMEVSSHALDQKRADGLAFDVGVFTNLTGDHLDYHGTMESYASAKARLFEMLPEDGAAVVNAEDPWSRRMVERCRARVLRCAVGHERSSGPIDCRATVLSMSMSGMRARFEGPWGSAEATLPLVGLHNAMNALQAIAAAHALGTTTADLRAGLGRAQAPPGRLEPVAGAGDDVSVLVDYAHTDDALAKVLAALRPMLTTGRLWVVFGCGGDRDRTKRPRMGRAASEGADEVVVTSDNPRTESPGSIIDEILSGVDGSLRHKIHVQADRERAIRYAVERARPGDVVLIAGKGHETEQILPDGSGGTHRRHFDDREVARHALLDRRLERGHAPRDGDPA